MHLFCGRDREQGKKQKPGDCAIMAFLNPSRKFMFESFGRPKYSCSKGEFTEGPQPRRGCVLDFSWP